MQRTITISANALDLFLKVLEGIAKKCAKVNQPEPTYEAGEVYFTRKEQDAPKVAVRDMLVTIPRLSFDGWTCIGFIDRIEKLVHGEVPKDQNHQSGNCEHCNTNRQRNKIFIVQRGDVVKRVGGACVKYYTGLSANELGALDFFYDPGALDVSFEEPMNYSGNGCYELEQGLALAVELVAEAGYISKTKSMETGEYCTADRFMDAQRHIRQLKRSLPSTESRERARLIREWLLDSEDDSTYMTNLRTIAENNYYSDRSLGLMVSVPVSYERHLTKLEEKANEIVPTTPLVEGRIELVGKILNIKTVENAYGFALKMILQLADGNKVYGTLPKALADDESCNRGSEVKFVAKVARSDDDEHFGFFSRPSKAELLA